MEEVNMFSVITTAVSFGALIISYLAFKTARKANKSTLKWHKDDMSLRNKEIHLKRDKEYKEMAKPYIDILYDCYNETKELTTEFSTKACQSKNNICNNINKYDNKLFSSNDFLEVAISRIILDNENDILFQIPESLLASLNNYSNLDENFLVENSNDKVKESLKSLYDSIDYDKRKELYDYAMKELKNVHNIYRNNKELIDKKIILMENEYMKFKRYYFGNRLDTLHEDYLEMLNLLKYIKYVERHYHYYKEIYHGIAISKMFTQISNVMIVNNGILKVAKLENYRDSNYLFN